MHQSARVLSVMYCLGGKTMVDVMNQAAEIETPEALREYFLLDPEIAFLNHGSFGSTPKPVFEVFQQWQRELEYEPVRFVARRQEDLLNEARAELATYVGADADDISFVVNTTSGLNVVARSLPLAPGDEILTTNLEYGALDYTWDYLCNKAGARYVAQEITVPFTTPETVVDELWAGVNERTRAIFLSHITSATAATLPVKLICERARKAGILTIVDGAHVPGHIPLDLDDLGADIYAGNCHKWLCAPKGAAFLYVRPEHQNWIESLTISWGWRPGHTFVTRNQQQGTRDVSAFLAVPAAIAFQREHRWDAVRARCHAMLRDFRIHMHDRLGTTPIYGDDRNWYAQLAVITLPEGDHTGLQDRLLFDHKVEVPLTGHGGQTFVRVSVQGYTSPEDLERLETALCAELGV
ncbi:MAG TPA: aminotransferase class V-fold PLP-dependent enzyme [Thermomicrobiales bacterium]|nr:aminotransferase class V-fold PLP-dependent enzyme [Thermomicrobiales bacterium]